MRTVQADIQIMRSDKLGYNAPIEVYDNKFYRYEDPDYSINDHPLSEDDCELLSQAVEMIQHLDLGREARDLATILSKVKSKLMLML